MAVACAAALMFATSSAAGASILEAVLERIAGMGQSPLAAIMANVAESSGGPVEATRVLRPGDRVIIGYDSAKVPVYGTASPAGVLVTTAQAEAVVPTGLAAGLYPVGSALYALPPAGQLSLYEEAQDGLKLDRARELMLSRIDGSVTNIVTGLLFPDLAPRTLISAYDGTAAQDLFGIDEINTTVLGAVNAGEIVTRVSVKYVTEHLDAAVGMSLAEISSGANMTLNEVAVDTARARSITSSQLGGPDGAALALNMAANVMEITGRVENRVQGHGASVARAVTTVIGAVNGGVVSGIGAD